VWLVGKEKLCSEIFVSLELFGMGGYFSSLGPSCICLEDDDEDRDPYACVMPSFYLQDHNFTKEDLNAVIKSWMLIINSKSALYLKLKQEKDFHWSDETIWFGSIFYDYFIRIYPAVTVVVDDNSISHYSHNISDLITQILQSIENPNETHVILMDMTIKNSQRGVHAIEYGIFLESFLRTLKHCLGEDYTPYTEQSWIKVVDSLYFLSIMFFRF
jgi:hemoglobin-like flavoprotein